MIKKWGLCLLAVSCASANAAEWRVLPVTEPDYKWDITASAIGGMAGSSHGGIAESSHGRDHAFGAEASFRCFLVQSPDNNLRQQLSYLYVEKNHFVELNPHLVYEVAPKLQLGVGPGLGVAVNEGETAFGAQVGASLHYRGLGPVFLGMEGRYQQQFGAHSHGNWRGVMKVGINFF